MPFIPRIEFGTDKIDVEIKLLPDPLNEILNRFRPREDTARDFGSRQTRRIGGILQTPARSQSLCLRRFIGATATTAPFGLSISIQKGPDLIVIVASDISTTSAITRRYGLGLDLNLLSSHSRTFRVGSHFPLSSSILGPTSLLSLTTYQSR